MIQPRVKICCIGSLKEAELAIKYGAFGIGLVGEMPSGPGIIDIKLSGEIVKEVGSEIHTFYLTSKTEAKQIIEEYEQVGSSFIQLVDKVKLSEYPLIRDGVGGAKIVQVVHVMDEGAIAYAKSIENKVDMILLDSGNPGLIIKRLGGTGTTHDWAISKKIVDSIHIPVFLAGGLHPGNVRRAIRDVGSYGLDICSGIRSGGFLIEEKLDHFMRNIVH
jgi:phosphoribosylanthranilate isomerase